MFGVGVVLVFVWVIVCDVYELSDVVKVLLMVVIVIVVGLLFVLLIGG